VVCLCVLGVQNTARALVSAFDSVVVIASILSVLLCTRSVYRALLLGRVSLSIVCFVVPITKFNTTSGCFNNFVVSAIVLMMVPYLTLPYLRSGHWTGSYTCPALRPYQFGPMRIPECNYKVTGSGYKAVDGYEAINRRL